MNRGPVTTRPATPRTDHTGQADVCLRTDGEVASLVTAGRACTAPLPIPNLRQTPATPRLPARS